MHPSFSAFSILEDCFLAIIHTFGLTLQFHAACVCVGEPSTKQPKPLYPPPLHSTHTQYGEVSTVTAHLLLRAGKRKLAGSTPRIQFLSF